MEMQNIIPKLSLLLLIRSSAELFFSLMKMSTVSLYHELLSIGADIVHTQIRLLKEWSDQSLH